MASIARFVLDIAPDCSPYYWSVPESFVVPAVYFEPPEVLSGGETFLTYSETNTWHIRFFAHSRQQAWDICFNVLDEIRRQRNLISLRDEMGDVLENEGIRINDPSMVILEDGSALLTLIWRSRKPYADTIEGGTKMQILHWFMHMKRGYEPSSEEVDKLLAFTEKKE